MASPGIKTKQTPRTYERLGWPRPAQVTDRPAQVTDRPAQVMDRPRVDRGLAGRGAGRKCHLLHLVAENREYNQAQCREAQGVTAETAARLPYITEHQDGAE